MNKKIAITNYIKLIILILTLLSVFVSVNTYIALIENDSPASNDGGSTNRVTQLRYYLTLESVVILVGIILALLVIKMAYTRIILENAEKESLIKANNMEFEKQARIIANLTELYNTAVKYDKLKTEFFANISHELKTPIAVILGAIQLIHQKRSCSPLEHVNGIKHLHSIKQNCYRLLRLINNILDITRIDAGYIKTNLVNCNIVYLVEEIAQTVIPYAEQKGLSFEFDTELEEIITAVDIDKIERIILNLLSNAIKFTPADGKISINICSNAQKVYILIKDTGFGIPENMQYKIFERFRQVSNSLTRDFEGSGIGLSLVKSFVELHGGTINVKSKEGFGSEFIVELPVKLCEPDMELNANVSNCQSKIIETINIELSDIYVYAAQEKFAGDNRG